MVRITKKLIIAVIAITMMLGAVFVVVGCNGKRVASPFTQEEILNFLLGKYGEEFVINGIVFETNRNGPFIRRIYSVSPKLNPALHFYVVDKNIQSDRIQVWDRVLKDTFPHALIAADFRNIADLCERLTLKNPSFDDILNNPFHFGSLTYNPSHDHSVFNVFLSLAIDFELADVDLIVQQLTNVRSHVIANLDNYKIARDLIAVKTYPENIVITKNTIQPYSIRLLVDQENINFADGDGEAIFLYKIEKTLNQILATTKGELL